MRSFHFFLSKLPLLKLLQLEISNKRAKFLNILEKFDFDHFINSKPSIAFDLDNTLIMATLIKTNGTDFSIRTPRRMIYVNLRPGLINFISELSKYYEIFIFTQFERDVALPIVEHISNQIKTHQKSAFSIESDHVFTKENCIFRNGYDVKDLTMLRRPLHKSLLIDDVIGCGLLQPFNCVGITPWQGEEDDNVLNEDLLPLLIECSNEQDIAEAVRFRKNNISQNLSLY